MSNPQQDFWNGFISSFSLILASELGDKTFLTTSIFSLEYPRLIVFLSSMAALTAMNILSILLGVLTTNISPIFVHYISIILFFVFGVKMIIEGRSGNHKDDDELKEIEKLISKEESNNNNNNNSIPKNKKRSSHGWKDFSFVFIKISSLVFITEFGDKSQLSTILLAAKEGCWAVALGSFCGNFISNAIAVLSSRVISMIISVESIQIIGGFVFVCCALYQLLFDTI